MVRNRDQIIERAFAMLGTPYKRLGRDRHGIDCLGLLLHVLDVREEDYPEFHEAVREQASYYTPGDKWNFKKEDRLSKRSCELLRSTLSKHLQEVSIRAVKRGDILLIRYKAAQGQGDHVAIYLGDWRMIHADIREGVKLEVMSPAISRRLIAAYRVH